MKELLLLILFVFFSIFIVDGKKIKGFTVNLIHRDSPQSPSYNATATPEERANAAFNRLNSQSKFQSTVFPADSEYLMKYSIGSPPLEQFAIIDTGSSLVWLQCHPCTNCYTQGSPNFYPFHSSSYSNIPCSSEACNVISRTTCGGPTINQCLYNFTYADNSFTRGVMATDTLSFDSETSRVEFPNIILGCGYNNSVVAGTIPSGVIGLGRGPSSLNSQLRNILQERFSYCFVPPEISGSNSKLMFGEDANILSGASFVSTPLLSHNDELYYLRLEGITIGNNRINNYDPTLGGNIVIDSGTTLTHLKSRLYADLEAALRRMIGLTYFPSGRFTSCYQTELLRRRVGDMNMVFHFAGGADITLSKTNIFLDGGMGTTCFAMIPDQNYAIFGNRAQINFNVQYDVINSRISFAHADYTRSD